MKLTIPIRPKVQAKASSSYTREQVESRLQQARDRGDERETAFLEQLKVRKGWN